MAGRDDNLRIRFIKPNDSGDEAEIESSTFDPISSDPGTPSPSPQPPSAPPPSTVVTPASPEQARPGQSRFRLAVSEFSMKLAQRIEEKCSNPEVVEKPSAKVDRLKRLALDVSKNVKTWSLEQQKLAGVHAADAQSNNDKPIEPEPRVRSTSLSDRTHTTTSTTTEEANSSRLSITDNGSGSTLNGSGEEPPVDRGVEALQIEETPEASSVRIPSSNRLKSISFNDNLAQICSSSKQVAPTTIDLQSSISSENNTTTSLRTQLSVLTEHLEGESVLNSTSSEPYSSISSSSAALEADVDSFFLPEKVRKLSVSLISAAKNYLLSVSQNKFFPAVLLSIFVLTLRVIGIPDMLVGCIVGTVVTWFLFIFAFPPHTKPRRHSQVKQAQHGHQTSGSQGKASNVALMHLAYAYNPCTFRLRYSYLCVVSLQGTLLKIGILDRKSVKECKTKFLIDLESPSAEQLEPLTFNESHTFDLTLGCSVSLCPTVLARKRYFNKKYPILIVKQPIGGNSDSAIDRPTTEGVISQDFYLFTLSMREKETWYTLLSCASHGISLKAFDLIPIRRIVPEAPKETAAQKKQDVVRLSKLRTSVSAGNIGLEAEQAALTENRENSTPKPSAKKQEDIFQFHYITRREQLRWFLSQATVLSPSSPIAWFNAFAWRVFFEMMSVDELKKQLEDKMQGKLGKIIMPRIIEPLKLSSVDWGHNMPTFKSSEPPFVDERGLWLTFMVDYDGGLTGTIETRVNLLKAKNANAEPNGGPLAASPLPGGNNLPKTPDLHYLDILSRDSCESCSTSSESDDDSAEPSSLPTATAPPSHSGHIIERVTNSKYFARLIAINSVGRAAERVSLIPLILRIELSRLAGRLRINFPPCPSDRIWIGFEDDDNFAIDLSLQPKVGNVELSGRTIHPIVSYLERKIVAEFKKKLVLPSMDDFYFGSFRHSIFKTDPVSSSTPPDTSPQDS